MVVIFQVFATAAFLLAGHAAGLLPSKVAAFVDQHYTGVWLAFWGAAAVYAYEAISAISRPTS